MPVRSRKDLIEQFKLTPGDITEMAVAHGSTAEFLFVRPQKPTPFTTAEKVYDILKANPNPDFFAIIEIELAARLPKIEAKCKCASPIPVHHAHLCRASLRRTAD